MKILIISVHPDDETLGCGGTILKHADNGDEIMWMIITKADLSTGYSKEFIEKRKEEINTVTQMYSFKKVYSLKFPTTSLHTVDYALLVRKISNIIQEEKPDIIYMNNRTDIHSDHRIAASAIISSTKAFRCPFIKKILMYECISETEMAPALHEYVFIPNYYCVITDYLERKINIMKVYESEIQKQPLPRSVENIKALARFRGSIVGAEYAEAFMLLREVN